MSVHVPILVKESIEGLKIGPGSIVVDATLGGGGHATAICQTIGLEGKLIGLDADSQALERTKSRMDMGYCQNVLIQTNFRHLSSALAQAQAEQVDAVFMDLGLSSDELADVARGFSFQGSGPLQMTFTDQPVEGALTAKEVVNEWSEETLADIIYAFGEEQFSRRIAKAIVEARQRAPLVTTSDLVAVIEQAVPVWYRKGRLHSATKTFQALRIVVNDELGALKEALNASWQALKPGGRIAIITFHSLEARIVKDFFKQKKQSGEGRVVNKKAITPTREEVKINPRARSAKLRIIEKKF